MAKRPSAPALSGSLAYLMMSVDTEAARSSWEASEVPLSPDTIQEFQICTGAFWAWTSGVEPNAPRRKDVTVRLATFLTFQLIHSSSILMSKPLGCAEDGTHC